MEPVKNVTGIIDAFNELVISRGLEDVELILIGNRNDNLRKYAEQTGLLNKHIFFKGEIPYADVAKEMQLSHCFILNSQVETFSCVTAEALCCGLPVITRNVGSLPELVDSNNGILINDHMKHSLIEALIQIKENYKSYNKETIAHIARQKYNYGTIGEQFNQLYNSL
jgi:glycosyltransferase involved in cell wall biosynthesis